MEKENAIVVGLDIGTTKICAIVGRKNEFGKLEILGMGSAPSEGVIGGVVINIQNTVDSIKKAISIAEEASNVSIEVVNVGIAGQHIKSTKLRGSLTRDNTDSEITPQDLEKLTEDMYKTVMPFGNEIIHVMPQLYTVDYNEGIKDPVGMSCVRLEGDFHVITAHTSAINNINKCVVRAGLKIDELILEPIASSLAVLSEEEKEAGVVLVDIGGGTTDVALFYEGIIRHTAVIPFGGNIITSDIQHGCNIMQKDAEKLKIQFGSAIANEANTDTVKIQGLRNRPGKEISIRNLEHIIQARMEEIIEMVYAEILASGFENKLAAGLVITGGGALLQNLKQLFEFMTGLDTRIGYPNEHLGKCKIEAIKSPMYATGVGLVLSGFSSIDERDNKHSKYLAAEQQHNKNSSKKSKEQSRQSLSFKNLSQTLTRSLQNFLLDDDINDSRSY